MPHVSDHDIRGKTHGDFGATARLAQTLKGMIGQSGGYFGMSLAHRECLELICTKIARISEGDSNFADHWNDIEGYARLAKDRCTK